MKHFWTFAANTTFLTLGWQGTCGEGEMEKDRNSDDPFKPNGYGHDREEPKRRGSRGWLRFFWVVCLLLAIALMIPIDGTIRREGLSIQWQLSYVLPLFKHVILLTFCHTKAWESASLVQESM
ncbi:hypothetical protein BDF20DRAFT_983931 [Mycotypha africana]|uniref:uncharacterized protein n=1 Tax=Mycotypha africana TaxID=64632 RepID=UPI002301E0DE|nr:uncharacterized protein BDF20DRAFT_983931 [Mycotypha africana]KAI8991234.1 hypothetical protein BDF20DRAFT_983931 [Mycotypha africana]